MIMTGKTCEVWLVEDAVYGEPVSFQIPCYAGN